MKKRPSFLAVLLAAGFVGTLAGTLLADSGVHLTLREHDEETIDTALEDKMPGPATQNVFSQMRATGTNLAANVFIRNPGLWSGTNVDLTAISVMSDPPDSYGTKFGITAISPIHCIGAAHVTAKPGTKFQWVGADNAPVIRTVVASLNPVDDVVVYVLDHDLPPDVKPMRILPRDWSSYLHQNEQMELPVLFINQQLRLCCAEAAGITPGNNPLVVYRQPSTRLRHAFWAQIISGDSSFPELLLVNGQPAILSLWHFGGAGAGPLEAAYYDKINDAMHKLSRKAGLPTDFQLRPVDMTGIAKL